MKNSRWGELAAQRSAPATPPVLRCRAVCLARDVLSVVTPFGTFTRTSHRPYTYVVVVCGTVLHPVEIGAFDSRV